MGSYTTRPKDLDVHPVTFATPDLTVFRSLGELCLTAVGQRLERGAALIECRFTDSNPW